MVKPGGDENKDGQENISKEGLNEEDCIKSDSKDKLSASTLSSPPSSETYDDKQCWSGSGQSCAEMESIPSNEPSFSPNESYSLSPTSNPGSSPIESKFCESYNTSIPNGELQRITCDQRLMFSHDNGIHTPSQISCGGGADRVYNSNMEGEYMAATSATESWQRNDYSLFSPGGAKDMTPTNVISTVNKYSHTAC